MYIYLCKIIFVALIVYCKKTLQHSELFVKSSEKPEVDKSKTGTLQSWIAHYTHIHMDLRSTWC